MSTLSREQIENALTQLGQLARLVREWALTVAQTLRLEEDWLAV